MTHAELEIAVADINARIDTIITALHAIYAAARTNEMGRLGYENAVQAEMLLNAMRETMAKRLKDD